MSVYTRSLCGYGCTFCRSHFCVRDSEEDITANYGEQRVIIRSEVVAEIDGGIRINFGSLFKTIKVLGTLFPNAYLTSDHRIYLRSTPFADRPTSR